MARRTCSLDFNFDLNHYKQRINDIAKAHPNGLPRALVDLLASILFQEMVDDGNFKVVPRFEDENLS